MTLDAARAYMGGPWPPLSFGHVTDRQFLPRTTEGALAGLRHGPPNRHAQASGKPTVVHLKVDPEAITPATTLTKLREQKSLVAESVSTMCQRAALVRAV
jgi:hypothetical protein